MYLGSMNTTVLGVFIFFNGFILQIFADCRHKPKWEEKSQPTNRLLIIDWLLEDAKKCKVHEVEYPSYDGRYHNLDKSDLGSTEQSLIRGWAGMSINSSQSKNWSNIWKKIKSDVSFCTSKHNALAFLMSKQIAYETLNVGNSYCVEMYGLEPLHTELNYATPYIDGGVIYGTSRSVISSYIAPKDGTIKIDNYILRDTQDIYSIVLKIIWIKWHNTIASQLYKSCPTWPSEKIFNEARKFTIAVQQNIYAYEWLPIWIGKHLDLYERYDPLIDPQVTKLFQAAMHLPQSTASYHCKTTCKQFKNANGWSQNSLLKLFETLISYSCKDIEKYGDVRAIEQQYALPDINHARRGFKLTSYSTWKEFADANKVADSIFEDKNVHHINAMLGGILESKTGPGILFSKVIFDQFKRIRNGDRLWFENKQNKLFSSEDEICKINRITFADIYLTVTNIIHGELGNISSFEHRLVNKSDNGYPLLSENNDFSTEIIKKMVNMSVKYALPAIALGYLFGVVQIAICLLIWQKYISRKSEIQENNTIKKCFEKKWKVQYPCFLVRECDKNKRPQRKMILVLQQQKKQIIIYSVLGTILQIIEFEESSEIRIIRIGSEPTAILKFRNHYDLVVKLQSVLLLESFINELDKFVTRIIKGQKPIVTNLKWRQVKKQLLTKEHYASLLQMFFRVAFAQAFKIEHCLEEMLDVDTSVASAVVYTKLTLNEFAECLRMNRKNTFVKTIFALVDRDERGFIHLRAFLDFIILFATGTEEQKAHLLFKLYNIDGTSVLLAKDFKAMLHSFLDIVGNSSDVTRLLRQSGLERKEKLDFRDFKKVIGHELKKLAQADLNNYKSNSNSRSFLSVARLRLQSIYKITEPILPPRGDKVSVIDKDQRDTIKPAERKPKLQKALLFCQFFFNQLFWFVLITGWILYMFVDKTYYFYTTTYLKGTNRYVFAISKGASYGIVLSYFILFITMCKNISTILKRTFLNKYLPLNILTGIHSYVAYLSAAFTLIHVIGHFYIFVSFGDYVLEPTCNIGTVYEEIGIIIKQKWQNSITISGFMLILVVTLVYVFAQPCIRRTLYKLFHLTHNLYLLIIILLVIHGSHSQYNLLYYTLSGPFIVFLIDIFIGMKKATIRVPVIHIEFLPSNVICLILKRPDNFQYDVCQWVYLAIHQINRREFHQYTLSSAPFEHHLRIYIKPTDPCAHQLRALAEVPSEDDTSSSIEVYIDGPYGTGLQQWRYRAITVLIGSENDVEIFASVLKDIAHVLQTKADIRCKKVYFIWTSKTQKHFEWMVDLIREIEDNDQKELFSAHLFITEFYPKFDVRTTIHNICDNYYPRIGGKSFFTSLKAATHFGTPNFDQFFHTLQILHETSETVGVFSSGSFSFTRAIKTSCDKINLRSKQRFEHHFLN